MLPDWTIYAENDLTIFEIHFMIDYFEFTTFFL